MQRYTKTTSRTIAWLRSIADNGSLSLAPPYQRNPVWTEKQQSALIETILLEYPIPELYMQDLVDVGGKEQHIVVDGQQRVRAVLDFIGGDFEMSEDIARWAGLEFDDLSPDDKKKVFEYDFVVRVLPEMDQEQISSIFQRINRTNVVLNQQELRHATYWGKFIKTVEDLADAEFWEIAGIFTANDRRRMLDAEYVSELAVAYLNGLQNKKAKLEDYYILYEKEFTEERRLSHVFYKVMEELGAILVDIRSTRWKKKSDFYTLFLLLADNIQLLPMSNPSRRLLRKILIDFGDFVDAELSNQMKLDAPVAYLPEVQKYAINVSRAASDLSARRNRRAALDAVLKPLFDVEAAAARALAEDAEARADEGGAA